MESTEKEQKNIMKDKQEILKLICDEAKSRPIIPFLGAGISISAGFPTIKYVVQYLAKVDFAIFFGIFSDRFPNLKEDQHQTLEEYYRQHPSKYLEDFGWPEIGQINVDLWDWLYRDSNGFEKIIRESGGNKQSKDNLDLLAYDIAQGNKLDLRDHIRAIVQWSLRRELAERESGAARAILSEWLLWKKHYLNNETKTNLTEPELLHGDWETLLDRLCEGNFDLADTLFTSFENGLNPTLSHRYLAFLQPKLGIPLLLTTNFDSFLEQAFQAEGIPTKVFDIHRNAELPNAALVRRQLSILKLHGSAYGLRLGERLKYPLEADDRSNTLDYIPSDALILVMGFNGSERRIMQMLNAMTKKQNQNLGSNRYRLIWIQGPGMPGPLYKELARDSKHSVQSCKVKHIDTFLIELYFYISSNSYQSSVKPYATISGKPLPTELIINQPKTSRQKQFYRRPVQLCLANFASDGRSSNWSSLDAIAFTNSLDNGYTVIWIDLINHHTVEGILADFFSQIHKVDSQAPSCLVTSIDYNSEDTVYKAIYKKIIERIRDVFKRGRYVLVLDSVESFGRPQMVHHGEPSYNEKGNISYKQIYNLKVFFTELLGTEKTTSSLKNYWDSYIVVSVNKPSYRHQNTQNHKNELLSMFEELIKNERNAFDHNHINIRLQSKKKGYSQLIADEARPTPDPSDGLRKHWKNKLGNNSENHSLERIKNVLDLLQTLRSDEENKEIADKNSVEAFICLLSIFRRPRSFPLLRSIIERWALRKIGEDLLDDNVSITAHSAINDLLKFLSEKNKLVGVVSQTHEGGIVWLFREIYETTYDALTENIHIQEWINKWENNQSDTPIELSSIAAIMDGVLNISLHLFAARAYYVDVFLPTHDINAFYEYLYHRVSATRIITLLITILEKSNDSIAENLDTYCKGIFVQYKDAFDAPTDTDHHFNWYAEVIGVFDPIFQDKKIIDSRENLLNNFKFLRKHALETLLMALTKNSLFFRSVATPDTVLAWSKQFLELELTNMHKIMINGKVSNEPDSDIEQTIEKLENKFNILN